MRAAKLLCEHASYNRDMTIQCAKTGTGCAHQKWCMMTGWAKLTEQWASCPVRKEQTNERKTAKKRRNKV